MNKHLTSANKKPIIKEMTMRKMVQTLYSPSVLNASKDIQEATIKQWLRTAYQHGFQVGQLKVIDNLMEKIGVLNGKQR